MRTLQSTEGKKIHQNDLLPDEFRKNKRASVLIMVSDAHKYFEQCIDSITKNTPESHEIILLTNLEEKAARDFLKETAKKTRNCHVIRCEKCISINSGISSATGDPIVIMHDDVIVSQGWFEDMNRSIDSDEQIGVVGPMTNAALGIQKDSRADYGDMDRFDEYAKKFRDANQYRWTSVRTVSDFCIMFRRALAEKIGLFDESIETPGLMVEDFCIRSGLEGLKISLHLAYLYNIMPIIHPVPATRGKIGKRLMQNGAALMLAP